MTLECVVAPLVFGKCPVCGRASQVTSYGHQMCRQCNVAIAREAAEVLKRESRLAKRFVG